MRVLLISPNRERLPDPVFPLGLSYVASALKEADCEVKALDLFFEDDIKKAITTTIEDFAPQLIGLSLRNIDDVSFPRSVSYIPLYREVIQHCRESSDAPIVAGGSGFTIMPAECMKALDIDYGVIGEGEGAMVLLVRHLKGETGLPDGIVAREGPLKPPSRSAQWQTIRPDRRLFNIKEYYNVGGMLNIQTKRGCPFGCIYCSYPKIEGRNVRVRSPEDVIDEMENIVKEHNIHHFFIVDSVFNYPRDYAIRFCRLMIERGLEVHWSCYATPGLMDGELIELMIKAGCEGVEFGTDSLDDPVLEALGKGFRYAQVKAVSEECKKAGLSFCHFVFIGSPGEDSESLEKTLERLCSLEADSSVIMAGIRIFPDTALAKRAEEELGIKDIGLEPVYYFSPRIIGDIDKIVDRISSEHPDWVFPGFEINFNERLQRLLRRAGKKGTLWSGISERRKR